MLKSIGNLLLFAILLPMACPSLQAASNDDNWLPYLPGTYLVMERIIKQGTTVTKEKYTLKRKSKNADSAEVEYSDGKRTGSRSALTVTVQARIKNREKQFLRAALL